MILIHRQHAVFSLCTFFVIPDTVWGVSQELLKVPQKQKADPSQLKTLQCMGDGASRWWTAVHLQIPNHLLILSHTLTSSSKLSRLSLACLIVQNIRWQCHIAAPPLMICSSSDKNQLALTQRYLTASVEPRLYVRIGDLASEYNPKPSVCRMGSHCACLSRPVCAQLGPSAALCGRIAVGTVCTWAVRPEQSGSTGYIGPTQM